MAWPQCNGEVFPERRRLIVTLQTHTQRNNAQHQDAYILLMDVCVCVWPVSVILFICWWKSQGSEEPDSEKHSLLFCFLKERSKSELLVDSGDRVEWTCLTLLTLCSGPFMCETPQCVSSSALYVWERQLHLCFSCCFFLTLRLNSFCCSCSVKAESSGRFVDVSISYFVFLVLKYIFRNLIVSREWLVLQLF